MTTNILGGGWRGMQLSQERIVFAIAAILFVAFSILLNDFLTTDNLLSLIQNVSILGILGIGMAHDDHRARHRPVDRRDHGDVGGVVPRPDRPGRRRAAGPADRAGDGGRDRPPERRPDRLCRDPRDLRHAGHGHGRLRFRPVLPGADRHHLSLRIRRLAEADRRRQRVRRAEPGHRLRDRVLRHLSAAPLHQARPLHLRAWATIRWRRASPAFRRAR